MAFYDDMKEKLTRTKDEVVQKKNNYTEISKLNTFISALESDITGSYMDIGRFYYREYAMTPQNINPAILSSFRKISENLKAIEGYRQEIRLIKGLKLCPECKKEISVDAVFCNYCGAKQIPIMNIQENFRICPKCGSSCGDDQLFCINCGCKLERIETIETREEKYCTNCGNKLGEGAAFCMICGKKWGEEKKDVSCESAEQINTINQKEIDDKETWEQEESGKE